VECVANSIRMAITHITVRGARQHNLRNISVSIPRNTLTVVTGLSGSGKSSLAFDTIYAEGQRRYVETLSAYARQFLDQMERPDVDAIDGLSPAISIEQKTTSRSPRSTVGTITEIYDYLRLLYASVGQPHCPKCGLPITRQTADQIVERIVAQAPGERITVYAPLVRGRKGEFREELEALDQQGFRARIDGVMTELTEGMRLDKRKNHTVEAVVDRIILKPLVHPRQRDRIRLCLHLDSRDLGRCACKPRRFDTRRLETSVAKALQMAKGLVSIGIQGSEPRAGRDAVLLVDGLPGLRHRRAPAGAAQLLVQLGLRRLPAVQRAGQHLRLRSRRRRSRTGPSRCWMERWGRVRDRVVSAAADTGWRRSGTRST
jgi:excinuclease ABC subunit A